MTKTDILWYTTQSVSMLFTFALAPAGLYFLVRKKNRSERKLVLWVPVVVIATWIFLVVFRIFVEEPFEIAHARQRGDFEADGVGGGAMVLVAGWVIPLIGSLLMATALSRSDSQKEEPNQAPEPTAPSGRGSS